MNDFTDSAVPVSPVGRRTSARWGLLAGLLAIVLVYWVSMRSHPSAIVWASDLKSALQQAEQTHRPVLVEFHTSWCSPCEEMEREVFPRREVAKALANWVSVQVDGDTNAELMRRYAVEAFPTFLALRPDGHVVRQSVGSMTPEEFVEFIRGAESEAKSGSISSRPQS